MWVCFCEKHRGKCPGIPGHNTLPQRILLQNGQDANCLRAVHSPVPWHPYHSDELSVATKRSEAQVFIRSFQSSRIIRCDIIAIEFGSDPVVYTETCTFKHRLTLQLEYQNSYGIGRYRMMQSPERLGRLA